MDKQITQIIPTGETWQGQSGTMYDFLYTFADGSSGKASHTTQQPRFQVGETVTVTENGEYNGVKKLKLEKPGQRNFQNRGGSKGGSPTGMRAGMALNNAVQLVCHGKVPLADVEKIAKRLVKIAEELEKVQGTASGPKPVQPASMPPQTPQAPQPVTTAQPQAPYNPPQSQQAAADQYAEQQAAEEDDDDIPF